MRGTATTLVLLLLIVAVTLPQSCDSTPIVRSILQVPTGGGSAQANNRFTVSANVADGALDTGNLRRFTIQSDGTAADGSKNSITADVVFSDIVHIYDKFYLGSIPKVGFNKVLPNCIPRLLPQERVVGAFDDTLETFAEQQQQQGTQTNSTNTTSPGGRSLLQIGVQDEGEGNQVFNVSALESAIGQVEFSAYVLNTTNILARADVTIQNGFNNLQTFQTINSLTQDIINNTLHLIPILNSSYQSLAVVTDREFSNFIRFVNSANTTVQAVLNETAEMLAQNTDRLEVEYNATIAVVLDQAQILREAQAHQSDIAADQTLVLQAISGSVQVVKSALTTFHEARERYIQRARYLAAAMDELRLDTALRRPGSAMLSRAKRNVLAGSGGTIVPVTSRERPALDPLGYVPVQPGENRFFVGLTFVYSTQVDPASLTPAVDTDIELLDPLTSELDAQRLQTYTTIVGNAGPRVFIHARRIYLYCNNDFLLSNRSLWYTAYDLMKFLGPTGCTPYVSCDCWAVVERERCSAAGNVPYLLNQTFPSLLGSGLCRDPTELNLWFSGSNGGSSSSSSGPASIDRSIAHEPAAENMTAEADLNAELSRMCRQTLVAKTDYKVHSSFFPGANTNNLIYHIPNDPTQCSTNQGSMQTQSNLIGFFTLPNRFYALATQATQSLFQNVSARFEAQKYGTEDRDVSRENQPFVVTRPVSPQSNLGIFEDLVARSRGRSITAADVRAAGVAPPRAVLNCDLQIPAFVSVDSVPFYLMIHARVEQTVNVTVTDARGNRLVQTLTDIAHTNTLATAAALPDEFFVAGHLDCWLLPCDTGTGSRVYQRYVYDTFDTTLSGSRQQSRRWDHPDYYMEFAVNLTTILNGPTGGLSAADQARLSPFAPPPGFDFMHNRPTMSVDDFNRQEDQLYFDSTRLTDGLQNYIIPLVQDGSVDDVSHLATFGGGSHGWKCDPEALALRGTGTGRICAALNKAQPLLPADSLALFPNLDQQRQFALRQTEGTFEVTFDIPALVIGAPDITTESRVVLCPDPAYIDVQTAPTAVPDSPAANLAQLTFVNTRGVPLPTTVEVSDMTGNLACHFVEVTTVAVNATQVVTLLPVALQSSSSNDSSSSSNNNTCSDVQRIIISTTDPANGFTATCWFRTLNLTAVFEQRDLLVLAQDPGARASGGLEAAVDNLNLDSVSRVQALQDQLVSNLSVNTAQMALISMANLDSQWQSAEAIAQRLVDQLEWQESISMPTGPVQLNQTAKDDLSRLVAQVEASGDAFIQALERQPAEQKNRFAQVRAQNNAVVQNLSRLVARLQELGAANDQVEAAVATVDRAQRVNFTAFVNAQTATLEEIAARTAQSTLLLSRLNNVSLGAKPFPVEDEPIYRSHYWQETESVGLGLLSAFRDIVSGLAGLIPGCEVFEVIPGRIPSTLTKACRLVVGLLDDALNNFGRCGLPLPFICDLLDWLNRILPVALIILAVIVGVCLCVQLRKK